VWDIKTTKLLLDRSFPNFHFCSAALSADGATVAALDKRTISLIDVDTGKTVRTLTARFEFGRLYFSPCGKRLAVTSNGGSVEVFDLSDGSVIPPFGEVFEPDSWLRRPEDWLRFRADGKIVARLLGEPGSTVWDPLSGKRVETIETPPGARLVLQVSPDGKRLIYASGKPGNVGEFKLWDRATKTDVAVSDFPKVIWPEFDYSADGK
jgi:WD40 repeat protein